MISYLQVEKLSKRFGDLPLFEDISFGIAAGDKIGLVAPNGSGKTTLLNILAGREGYDGGSVVVRNDLVTAYLEQTPSFDKEMTVIKAMGAGEDDLKVRQMLSVLNITDLGRRVGELSGGQVKRLAIAALLVKEPHLMLLDEPTNHLDLETTEWLEGRLIRRNISLLMVTHDRYFLDRVCNVIIEIDERRVYRYKGNYSYFLGKKSERSAAQNAEAARVDNLMRKELEWMRRQPQGRGTKAKYRVEAFASLEEKARDRRAADSVSLNVKASYIGSKIFEAAHVSKSFGDIKIVEDFTYTFARYEKMGITGNNGTGKTTFIKMLTGIVAPDSGHFDVGETVRFGYYSQEGMDFDDTIKVIDVARDIAEYVDMGLGREAVSVTNFLSHFLFPPDKQHSYVARLSGGERRRLYLCTILMRNPNFLILDEPTNDLDIVTMNILEDYLINFGGCVIIVSHDRYFMDKVADHLLVFTGNGKVKDFPGNYSQYRARREVEGKAGAGDQSTAPTPQKAAPVKPRSQSAGNIRKLTFKERREMEALEAGIAGCEEEKARLEASISHGNLTNDSLVASSLRIGEIIDEIDAKTARWFELSQLA
ncbi:MAG: ABC-F family ATP-binding cassette domain-containing protein [Tannerellaceae bacterium]|jgi:ATP-binding cassette subfamily F protein uup|nr:ABC-F family ATP-binding cassette domain-containing protein [Tannerellaceae bacterium]